MILIYRIDLTQAGNNYLEQQFRNKFSQISEHVKIAKT